MKIPFLNIQREQLPYLNEIKEAVSAVVDKGWYIQGERCAEFEQLYATYCGVKTCVGVASGLDALRLIFRAYIEMGVLLPGDEIILPANTFIASALAISDNGLTPVFADCDPNTYNLSVATITPHITDKTRGILLVHLYGQVTAINEIQALSKENNFLLIEDAAQAHGAIFENTKAGALGDAAAFSFYPTKNLACLGDGGAVTSNNLELATLIRSLGNYGVTSPTRYSYKGINSRLDEMQAAVLCVKLKYLDSINKIKQLNAKKYKLALNNEKITLPCCPIYESHVFYQYVIQCDKRDSFMSYLFEKGIETQVHYPNVINKQPVYEEKQNKILTTAESISERIVSLPIYASLLEDEITYIIDIINRY